jgi:hypothetical protein
MLKAGEIRHIVGKEMGNPVGLHGRHDVCGRLRVAMYSRNIWRLIHNAIPPV